MPDNTKLKPTKINGGTRSGIDRRQFTYTAYIPERRSGKDRRENLEQRNAGTIMRQKNYKQDHDYGGL